MRKAVLFNLLFFLVTGIFAGGNSDEDISNPGPVLTENVADTYNLGVKFTVAEEDASVYTSIDGIVYRYSRNEENSTNFGRFIEFECSDSYFYENEERIVKFYILYSNLLELNIDKKGEQIDRGTEIGKAGGSLFDNNLLVCIYTFEKDPYISYLTKSVSANLLDAYWYDPKFLFDENYDTFNYFKYEEVELDSFISEISEEKSDSMKIDILDQNIRFFITLDNMPGEIDGNAALMLEASSSVIDEKYNANFMDYFKTATELYINNTKVYVLWPEEFDFYLNDEIGPGNEVYVYGLASAYNHYDNSVLILAGDFTIDRLETLINMQYKFD